MLYLFFGHILNTLRTFYYINRCRLFAHFVKISVMHLYIKGGDSLVCVARKQVEELDHRSTCFSHVTLVARTEQEALMSNACNTGPLMRAAVS